MVNNPRVSFSYAATSVRQKGAFVKNNNNNSLFESVSSKKSLHAAISDFNISPRIAEQF